MHALNGLDEIRKHQKKLHYCFVCMDIFSPNFAFLQKENSQVVLAQKQEGSDRGIVELAIVFGGTCGVTMQVMADLFMDDLPQEPHTNHLGIWLSDFRMCGRQEWGNAVEKHRVETC